MDNFRELVSEFLKSGNYLSLLILLLIGAIWYLSKALKQKDEFILRQYEHLQSGISELQDEVQTFTQANSQCMNELKDRLNDLEKSMIEMKTTITNSERRKKGG